MLAVQLASAKAYTATFVRLTNHLHQLILNEKPGARRYIYNMQYLSELVVV